MRSTLSRSIVLLAAACLAAAAFAVDRYDKWVRPVAALAVGTWRAGWDWITDGLMRLTQQLPAPPRIWPQVLPRHQLAMRDYVHRQTRLQRPRLMPQWSFAPSA